ncbi:MAG: class I SAM-dependent methyltransferase [Actinomycetota bacterium]
MPESDPPCDPQPERQPDAMAATIAAYDATVDQYLELVGREIRAEIEQPLDRALLAAFAEHVVDGPDGPVADLGCGPGRVAALLDRAGLPVVGVDLSAGMLAAGRSSHPALRFVQGALGALPLADATLAGAVAWYSVIHTPPAGLAAIWGELHRVLVPGGRLLLGFQTGAGERVERPRPTAPEHVSTSYRHPTETVTAGLAGTGLLVDAVSLREPVGDHETTAQAFVLAHRP